MLTFFQICSDEPLIYAAMEIEFSQAILAKILQFQMSEMILKTEIIQI